MSLIISFLLIGLSIGSIYAISGIGIVLTYRATGVFNFAHGPIAILTAYVFWQLHTDWGWRLLPSAFLAIIVFGPAVGLLVERIVFRPLERAQASTATKLAATMGLFVAVLGVVIAVWGGTSKPAPSLFPRTSVQITDELILGVDQMANFLLGLAVSGGLLVFLKYTRTGIATRAVVDRRELAELSAVNADRISALAWALGAWLAGLGGVLLAPTLLLDPPTFLLVVLGSYACAVGGGLYSLPVTYAVGLGLGVADQMTLWYVAEYDFFQSFFQTVRPQYYFIAFLVLSVVRLRNVVEVGSGVLSAVRTRVGPPLMSFRNGVLVAIGLVVLPFVLDSSQIGYAQQAVNLGAVFLSLVVLTGFTGQLNLGVAGFAGMGAFGAARLANDVGLPVALAIPVAAIFFAVPVGLLLGYFAVRRRGLVLGLVTMAAGVLLFAIAFQNLTLTGGVDGSVLDRPGGFEGERAFYLFELGFIGLLMWFAHNLRSGRLGRILTAMRDSEEGATSIGLSLARYKLLIFAASAGIAGVGGGLYGAQAGSFSFGNFTPFDSLTWFTVVAVAGMGYISAGLLGGFILALLPVFVGDLNQLIIGIGALTLGRMGGGLIGLLQFAGEGVRGDHQQQTRPPLRVRRPPPVGKVASGFARERMEAAAEVAEVQS